MTLIDIVIKSVDGVVKKVKIDDDSKLRPLMDIIEQETMLLRKFQRIIHVDENGENYVLSDESRTLRQMKVHQGSVILAIRRRPADSLYVPPDYYASPSSPEYSVPTLEAIANFTSTAQQQGREHPKANLSGVIKGPTAGALEAKAQLEDLCDTLAHYADVIIGKIGDLNEAQLPPIDEAALEVLVNIGFPTDLAKRALLLNRMDVRSSSEWLANHHSDTLTPFTPQVISRIARQYQSFRPDPSHVSLLIDMGFSNDDALAALRVTNDNVEAATSWLLGERHIVLGMRGRTEVLRIDNKHPIIRAVVSNSSINRILGDVYALEVFNEIVNDPSKVLHYWNDPSYSNAIISLFSIFMNYISSNIDTITVQPVAQQQQQQSEAQMQMQAEQVIQNIPDDEYDDDEEPGMVYEHNDSDYEDEPSPRPHTNDNDAAMT